MTRTTEPRVEMQEGGRTLDSKKKKKDGASRRDFLKLAGTSAPAAVAAMAVGTGEAAAEETTQTSGYRKTEHVKKYLASARF